MHLLLVIAFVFIPWNVEAGIKYKNPQQELFVYEEKIKIIHQTLLSECPSFVETKREVVEDILMSYTLEVSKKLYDKLMQDLIKCRESMTTTTPQPIPRECQTATNLTQSWRLDHNGSEIKPGGPHSYTGYACDFHRDLQWFRFTGDAGNLSLKYSIW